MRSDVRYYLERAVKGKPARITLMFKYRIGIFKYSTGLYVIPEHWDKSSQRIKEKFLSINEEYVDSNQMLDDLASETRRIYRKFLRERRLLSLNNEELKKRLKAFQFGLPIPSGSINLKEFFEIFILEREKGQFSPNSIKQYRATQKHFDSFCKWVGYNASFEDVSLDFFIKFRNYFWQLEPPQSDNNVHKHVSTLKLVLEQAVKRKHTDNTEFRYIKIASDLGIKKEVADSIALYLEELTHLHKFDLSKWPELDETRDLFLNGCFTGLRFSDWGKIQSDQIKNYKGTEYLEIFTQKTRKKIAIPLHPFLKDIGEKYKWNFPKIPANPLVNRRLKEMGEKAGFTETISFTQRIRGRKEYLHRKKFEMISTHTARRSFATNGYLARMDIKDLMSMTGHANEKDFMNYIKSPLEARTKRIADSAFFKIDPVSWKIDE